MPGSQPGHALGGLGWLATTPSFCCHPGHGPKHEEKPAGLQTWTGPQRSILFSVRKKPHLTNEHPDHRGSSEVGRESGCVRRLVLCGLRSVLGAGEEQAGGGRELGEARVADMTNGANEERRVERRVERQLCGHGACLHHWLPGSPAICPSPSCPSTPLNS